LHNVYILDHLGVIRSEITGDAAGQSRLLKQEMCSQDGSQNKWVMMFDDTFSKLHLTCASVVPRHDSSDSTVILTKNEDGVANVHVDERKKMKKNLYMTYRKCRFFLAYFL
jgi:hypothetical protein